MILPSLPQAMKDEVERIEALFAHADWVEAHTLLSAKTMLDVYGEAIRDVAYIVHDPIDGDYVLRPDFTVPIVERHMSLGSGSATYAYSGRVWRKRRRETHKHSFWQMGFERFEEVDQSLTNSNQPEADAEILALALEVANDRPLPLITGDLSLIFSILNALEIPDWRKKALMRHVWRPKAFAKMLARYSSPNNKHRELLINAQFEQDIPFHGLRTKEMIEARIARLKEDQKVKPIDPRVKSVIDEALAIVGNLETAEVEFAQIAREFSALTPFALAFSQRNQALRERGIDISGIRFSAGFGRETMEYYDGFVFSFGEGAIVGGRYNGLTAILGQGREINAIGLACRLDRLVEAGHEC